MLPDQLLKDLASEIDQGFLEEPFEYKGHVYKMRLLSDGESNWKNRYIDGMANVLSIVSERRSATLAVAIREIDGVPVEKMYEPKPPVGNDSDEDKLAKIKYEEWSKLSPLRRQFQAAEKLYEFLAKRPETFSRELFEKYATLEARRDEVINNLKK